MFGDFTVNNPFLLIVQKKQTGVLRFLGQQIQHEMHLKSTISLGLHLPVLHVYVLVWMLPRLFHVCLYLFMLFCSHTSAFMYMHTSVQKTPKRSTHCRWK